MIAWSFWQNGPPRRLKCRKGPPDERIGKSSVAACSPGDAWHLPPWGVAARRATDFIAEPKRETALVGPAATDSGGMLTWRPACRLRA